MSTLSNKLAEKSPQDADRYLASLWKAFSATEECEALTILIKQIGADAEAVLLAPNSDPTARAHAAGQVAALKRLTTSMAACITFDPTKAEYAEPDLPTDDLPEDSAQII